MVLALRWQLAIKEGNGFMLSVFLEILFSFSCSVGFGIVFGIKPKELGYAGLAGVAARIAIMLCRLVTGNRLIYTLAGALFGALYAELLGRYKKTVVTKFLYPAMVPMIPGDLLYNTIVCIVSMDGSGILTYGKDLVQALLGIALGAMIAPMLLHSKRYMRNVLLGHG